MLRSSLPTKLERTVRIDYYDTLALTTSILNCYILPVKPADISDTTLPIKNEQNLSLVNLYFINDEFIFKWNISFKRLWNDKCYSVSTLSIYRYILSVDFIFLLVFSLNIII